MNFRRVIKADQLAFNISTESWMELAENRSEWRYLVIAGKYWNTIEWCCLREQERDVRYAAKGMRNTQLQTVTTNGRGTSQRRSSDRVRRRQQTLDQNPEFKEVHEVVCANDGRIVARRGANEFFEMEQVQCVEAAIWSVSLQQDGAIVEEATTAERTRRVCAKGSAARTIVKIVFMIDIYIHAYDYLLSHQLELVAETEW